MRQAGRDGRHGHREITALAVARLYRDFGGRDGLIRGIGGAAYFSRLNRAQARADRLIEIGVIPHYAGSRLPLPYLLGRTTHSAYANGAAQREHFMADPRRSAEDNLAINEQFVVDQLQLARQAAHRAARPLHGVELRGLGAAVHALQDSYSGAHAWREDSVYDGDPTAPIRALHVFTPLHVVGLDRGRNTHVDAFDRPPAGSGSVRAAVEGTYRLLVAHELTIAAAPDEAEQERRRRLAPMMRASATGVVVSLDPTDERWRAEVARRIELESRSPTPRQVPAPNRSARDHPADRVAADRPETDAARVAAQGSAGPPGRQDVPRRARPGSEGIGAAPRRSRPATDRRRRER